MKQTILMISIFLTLSSCSILFDSYKSKIDGVYIPKNLDEAISELDTIFSDSLKFSIKTMTEEKYTAEYHMSTGLWIRNNWNLWKGSRLTHFFKRKGIYQPDDMSGIILTSYYRHLMGKEILLSSQISEYKKYWDEARKLSKLVALPKESEFPEKDLRFGYAKWHNNNEKKSIIYFQTNSKNDSVWIYDYLYGWKKIDHTTEKDLKNGSNPKTDSLMNKIFNK